MALHLLLRRIYACLGYEVTANCTDIHWDNDSLWSSIPTPVAITDVHIIAMNHLDVGYNGIPEIGLINNSG